VTAFRAGKREVRSPYSPNEESRFEKFGFRRGGRYRPRRRICSAHRIGYAASGNPSRRPWNSCLPNRVHRRWDVCPRAGQMTHPKRPWDPNQLAKSIIDIATGEKPYRDRTDPLPGHERGRQLRRPNRKLRRSGIRYAKRHGRADTIHRPAQLT
jgi:hypothetical protein